MLVQAKRTLLIFVAALTLAPSMWAGERERSWDRGWDEYEGSVLEAIEIFREDIRFFYESATQEEHLLLLQNAEVLVVLSDELGIIAHSLAPDALEAALKFDEIRGIFANIATIINEDEFYEQTFEDFDFLSESFSFLDEFYAAK